MQIKYASLEAIFCWLFKVLYQPGPQASGPQPPQPGARDGDHVGEVDLDSVEELWLALQEDAPPPPLPPPALPIRISEYNPNGLIYNL